jgi:glutathione-regulated potassium-efflux system ancillary protein KefG
MSRKILILFAHPRYEKSLNNKVLVAHIMEKDNITFHDLYEEYPDFNIDTEKEKELLTQHDVIVWQHPFYWYSSPPLLKQWIDIVLEFGWAYGPGGTKLQGKYIFNTITTGGQRSAYSREGYNRFTVKELLVPFEQTAVLCKMTYLPPFALHGTHRMTREEALRTADQYKFLLNTLSDDTIPVEQMTALPYLNDWVTNQHK